MSGWKFRGAPEPCCNYTYCGEVGSTRLIRDGAEHLWVAVQEWSNGVPTLGGGWGAGVPVEEPVSLVKGLRREDCVACLAKPGQPHSLDCPEKPLPAPFADANPKSTQGAKKHSLRYLPLPAAVEVNRAFADGALKYGAANWRTTGVAASVYVDACLRHLFQWYDGGQERASDSGVHNLGHAMACLAILMDAQHVGKLVDDRPSPISDSDSLLLRVSE